MTFLIAAACGAVIWAAIAFPVAVVVGKAAHHADPGEDGPDDLMALVQPENLRLPDTGIDAAVTLPAPGGAL